MNFNQPYQPDKQAQLSIPAQFTEPGLRAWLAELPLANAEQTGDILLHALRTLERTAEIDITDRFAQLECLHAAAQILLEQSLDATEQEDATFPLHEFQNRRAHRAYSLIAEIAAAYQAIALGSGQPEPFSSSPDFHARVLFRSAQSQGELLLQLLENYQPPPPQFWKTTYDIFQTAMKHRVTLETIASEKNCATVYAQFMRIVLLSLINAYRNRPHEIRQLYTALGELADKAELRDSPVHDNLKAGFFLDLVTDIPPQPLISLNSEGPVERRFILTQTLVKWASARYADASSRVFGGNRVTKSLLSHLLRSLALPERRKSKRYPETGKHRIYLGITALETRLSGREDVLRQSATSEHVYLDGADWLEVPDYQLKSDDSPGDVTGRNEERMTRNDRQMGIAKDNVRSEDIWIDTRRQQAQGFAEYAPSLEVWLLNSSAQGYCLLWTDHAITGARVGELVGVESEGGAIHLGMIRWLNHNSAGDLMLGLQLISPDVEAGQIWPLNNTLASIKALYVRANTKLNMPAKIFVSVASLDVGVVAEWRGLAARRLLKLDRIDISTPAFVAFAVSPAVRGGL